MEEEKPKELDKKEASKYLRFLITEWSAAESEKERLNIFITLRKLVVANPHLMENAMKSIYLAFVKNCKQYNEITHQSFIVMRNCVTELFSLDTATAYQHAFVYVRQLAIHVRNAMTSMTEEEIKGVYNWQYMNCLRLWTYMVIQPSLQEPLKPLVYPLIQVIDSTINLIPSSRYYPIRLHCIDLYIQLVSTIDIFIPVAPLLLDIIENEKFMMKPDDVTSKPPDVTYAIKISKTFLGSRAVQDIVVSKAIALLADYMQIYEKNVSFPELAYPVTRSLKAYSKRCRVNQWSNAARSLSQKLDKQIDAIIRLREGITGAPKDMKDREIKNSK